ARVALENNATKDQEFTLTFAGTEFKLGVDVAWGGQLGGLHDAEYNSLRATQETVGQIAKGIADLFNGVLNTGAFDVNGNPGQDLFTYKAGSISQVLEVKDLAPEELAFSSNAAEPGNNVKLLELLTLKNQTVPGITIGGATANV